MKKKIYTTCEICGNNRCETFNPTENDNLARYGLLTSPDTSNTSTSLGQHIAYCQLCCYAWNVIYDPANVIYTSDSIIEAGHFSPRYMAYQKDAAEYLSKLIQQSVNLAVEIGAGAGIFLKMIAASRKIAFEPSGESKFIDPSIEVINDYFSADKIDSHVNLVILRQVLEHIARPQEFLRSAICACDRTPEDDFYLYLEVPNSEATFKSGRFYDFYYEHCNHFSLQSISNMANNLGLQLVGISSEMDGELICVLLKRGRVSDKSAKLISFRMQQVEQRLRKMMLAYKDKMILAWGACGNGTVALNKLDITTDVISFVIDSDVNKQGKYIPGTCQKIISPEAASKLNPDLIIILSQLHKVEIAKECQRIFGDSPAIEVL
jgi:hypothetical protein